MPQPALAPGIFNPGRALPSGGGAGGLAAVLGDVVAATDVVRGRGQLRGMRAALLHLVAEMLVDDLGDGMGTTAAARRAREAVERLDPSPGAAEAELLLELADADRLRRRLE